MNKNLNKLVLGGAQISTNKYGVTNNSSLKKKEIKNILDLAKKNKINFVDTAKSYKGSEEIIGKSNNKFSIITKLQKFPNNQPQLEKWITDNVDDSLKKLKQKKVYGILIHNINKLSHTKLLKIIEVLKKLKHEKKTQFIGISIYDPKEISFFWKDWKPDIIQVPYNILDRRIETSGWLKKLKKYKVKVHIRSIFLQGLLLSPKNKIPIKVIKLKKVLDNWFSWCKKNNTSPLEECLSFSLKANVDKIIVGVYSKEELKNLIKNFKLLKNKSKNFPIIKYTNLIDPRKWS